MEFAYRKILWALPIFLLCSLALFIVGVEASHKVYSHLQSRSALDVSQVHRTGYHFQPPKHWINGKFCGFFLIIIIMICITRKNELKRSSGIIKLKTTLFFDVFSKKTKTLSRYRPHGIWF